MGLSPAFVILPGALLCGWRKLKASLWELAQSLWSGLGLTLLGEVQGRILLAPALRFLKRGACSV